MASLVIELLPDGDGWAVRLQGREAAPLRFGALAEARSEAERLAQELAPAQLRVHDEEGRIRSAHGYVREKTRSAWKFSTEATRNSGTTEPSYQND